MYEVKRSFVNIYHGAKQVRISIHPTKLQVILNMDVFSVNKRVFINFIIWFLIMLITITEEKKEKRTSFVRETFIGKKALPFLGIYLQLVVWHPSAQDGSLTVLGTVSGVQELQEPAINWIQYSKMLQSFYTWHLTSNWWWRKCLYLKRHNISIQSTNQGLYFSSSLTYCRIEGNSCVSLCKEGWFDCVFRMC